MLSYRPRTDPNSRISSSRPLTPPSSSLDGADDDLKHKATNADFNYVPNILDLVTPSRDAAYLTTKYIPAVFLQAEAVDSSILIGNGASFSASLQRIPDGPQMIETTIHNEEGWSVTNSEAAPPRPKYVVYKVAKVAFKEDGEPFPEYRRALQSVLTEYHALIYPPLFHHANIIDFLGFAWGSNPFSAAHRLPAIVVGFAEHGTLADLLRKNRMLEVSVKHMLCLDIVRGLTVLHGAGLVHGDVKAENVLVCSGSNRKFVAKIADFGFSIVEATETAELWIGGTNPWRAPETKNAIEVRLLRHTDTYSLGLLIWLICIDGRSPFDLLVPATILGATRNTEIERLKQSNELAVAATAKAWLMSWSRLRIDSSLGTVLKTASKALVNAQRSSEADLERASERLRERLYDKLYEQTRQQKLVKSLDDIFLHSLQVNPALRDLSVIRHLLESIEDVPTRHVVGSSVANVSEDSKDKSSSTDQINKYTITNHSGEAKTFTLTKDQIEGAGDAQASVPKDQTPSVSTSTSAISTNQMKSKVNHTPGSVSTSMFQAAVQEPVRRLNDATVETVAKLLHKYPPQTESDLTEQSPSSLPSWTVQGYKHHWLSWQKMRILEPSEQHLIFDSVRGTSGPELFILCSFYMNGYGCDSNVTEALEKLKQAADKGHHISRAYMYRIYSACNPSELVDLPGRDYLYDYTIAGSRPAFEDLQKVGLANKVQYAQKFLSDACAGVGSSWFDRSEMLHGYTQSQWMNDAWFIERIKTVEDLSTFTVNKRGDSVLHFAAACGCWRPFKRLIVDYKMDVNILNPLRETPLLCACRSRQGGIAILCLQTYKANASIAANNGETPLHWLLSFSDIDVEPLLNDLIANGANIHAMTKDRISHSKFPSSIDVDFQMPGTALSWAVHHNRPHIVKALLSRGADPNLTIAEGEMTPLKWAAYYHHHQCLKLMIEHLEGKATAVTSDGKIYKRKVLIFGPVIQEAIHTSDRFSMILRNGSDYLNHLHATLDLLREKTEYINTQSRFNGNMLYYAVSEAHDEAVEYMFKHNWRVDTLNDPCVPGQRTALLEAIRWNRRPLVELLLSHGADAHARAADPFQPELLNWSALHVFAQEGHNNDVSLVQTLVQTGIPVDGPTYPNPADGNHTINEGNHTTTNDDLNPDLHQLSLKDNPGPTIPTCETPFAVALRHNAFHLSSTLLSLGANPNALTLSSGLFKSPHPLTILGHIIISNARYSTARLKYLLNLPTDEKQKHNVDFIVEPVRQLSALHRAAMAYQDITSVITNESVTMRAFDLETNRDILYELLLRWPGAEQLDMKCGIGGNTALHLAVEAGNAGAVESLLRAGAGTGIRNEEGKTAKRVAERVAGRGKVNEEILLRLSLGRMGGDLLEGLVEEDVD